MRKPNCSCVLCGKPLYRKPHEFKKVRYFACMEHRAKAQSIFGVTEAQEKGLALGRQKGTNHLEGIPKSEESKIKRSVSMLKWCSENPDLVKAKTEKIKGENNYQWKGGTSRLTYIVRHLHEHRKWAKAVVGRDGCCQHCGSIDELEAHHIIELTAIIDSYGIETKEQAKDCPALWDINNGLTLCKKCHCTHHDRSYTPNGQGLRKRSKRKST